MNDADLILLPREGAAKSDLVDLRRAICAELLTQAVKIVEFDMPRRADRPDYVGAVLDWHDAIAALWMEQIARHLPNGGRLALLVRSEEHTSELQSLMRISYAVFCLKKKKKTYNNVKKRKSILTNVSPTYKNTQKPHTNQRTPHQLPLDTSLYYPRSS